MKKKQYLRSDGLYRRQVYLGKKDGKAVYKSVYGQTQAEVEEKAIQIKLAHRKGIDVTADRDSFEKWAQRWLKTKKGNVSAGRYQVYSYCLDKLSPLNSMPLSKIRTIDLQDIINDLAACNPHTGRPSAKKTLASVKSAAFQIFNLAFENRVVEYNPASFLKIPTKAPEEHRRALTEEEQQWILTTPHRAQIGAMIMMYAGLRRGELIPLTWDDIDLPNRTISVNKSVEIIRGQSKQKNTGKTQCAIRTIDIPNKLVEFLQNYKENHSTGTLVLPSAKGTLMSESSWRRLWESYLTEINFRHGGIPEDIKSKYNPHGVPFLIPHITAHWLRHTFITLMYLSGVDVMTAKIQAGHSDIKTTLQIYTHLDKKYKRNSMNKLDDYLLNQSEGL